MMRITLFFVLITMTQVFAGKTYSQNARLSLRLKNVSTKNILQQIEDKTNYYFIYDASVVDVERKTSIEVVDETITDILDVLFAGSNVEYKINNRQIALTVGSFNPPIVSQQQKSVSGRVTDSSGSPLPGVTVVIKSTTQGTITDIDGNYSLNNVLSNGTLVFSFVGMRIQEITVGGKTSINVVMEEESVGIEEVVAVGYRTQARGTITGSISTVNSNQLKDTPVDNLSNALAGKLSGVTISQAAGTPGLESNIRIRAIGTFNNASPLYVIDGVVRDKFAFDVLNPSEVENISILKDGASASIYGSRAANGVILVTTKRGSNKAPSLSFSSTIGIQTPTRMPESLNAYEHATMINDGLAYQYYYNDNFIVPDDDVRLYTQDELDYFKEHSWDWVDELWENPVTTNHSLSVKGGNDNVRYFMGGSYIYSTGSFDNLNYRKFNLRGNLDVDITTNLTASLDISTDSRMTKGPNYDVDDWTQSALSKTFVVKSAIVPPYINGQLVGNWVQWSPSALTHRDIGGYNDTEWTGLNATLTLNYKVPFVDGLGFNIKYNRFQRDKFTKRFQLPFDMIQFNTVGTHNHILGDQPVGVIPRSIPEFLTNRNDRDKSYQFNAQLNYKKALGKHKLDAFFVYEQTESNTTWFLGRRDNFISPSIDQFVGGGRSAEEQQANGAEKEFARLSYVGSVNYDYDNRYFIEASFRCDGSVIFAPENRWGFFPSSSLGWRISSEPFFNSKFINDLMIRGSVGLVGNDNVGSFQWLQSFNLVDGAAFEGVTTGLKPGTLANRNITWEKSLSYNAGINSRFWKNTMSFRMDMFYRHTYDILLPRVLSVPTTFGASLPDENYAEVNAKGFELELGYNGIFGSGDNEVQYYINGNFGYSTNKIAKADVGENTRPYESKIGRPVGLTDNYTVNLNGTDLLFGLVATDIIRTQEDLEALPEGYTILGEAPQLGMLNYKDIRGPNSDDSDGRITNDDREYLGKYSIPPMNYGLSLGASWKAFSIDVLFQGTGGQKIMLEGGNGRRVQGRVQASSYKFWNDHWTVNNPDAAYPAVRNYGFPVTDYPASNWFVKNGAFLRLKNLTVSYTLPKRILRTKSVRLFYAGTNLFLVFDHIKKWGYDPEAQNILAYPIMTTHSFGLNIEL